MSLAGGLTILSVAYTLAPVGLDAVGGAEQVLSSIDHALVTAGHRSLVVACRGSQVAGEWIDTGVEVPDMITDECRRSAQAATRRAIADALSARAVDLVHLHGVDFGTVLPAAGPPALVTLHLPLDWYPTGTLPTARERTWLHGVSEAQSRSFPSSATLLAAIPNGVPVGALARASHARRSFALMLGRVCAEKGQHLALQAAHRAGIALLIGGTVFGYEAHRTYFENQVSPLLDRRRRFLGPLAFDRKRRLMSAARLLLLPSLAAETSSLVAMEAAACGTPVVAFRAGALNDIVVDGQTGFLVDGVEEMAARVAQVGGIDPATCRRVARERFSRERMNAAYLERYRTLVAA